MSSTPDVVAASQGAEPCCVGFELGGALVDGEADWGGESVGADAGASPDEHAASRQPIATITSKRT